MLIPKDDDVGRALKGRHYLSRNGAISDDVSHYYVYHLLVGAIFKDELEDIVRWIMSHQDKIDWGE